MAIICKFFPAKYKGVKNFSVIQAVYQVEHEIVISMEYQADVEPFFTATYGEKVVTVEIDGGDAEGRFPVELLQEVLGWRDVHVGELMDNWGLLRDGREPKGISGLCQ